LLAAVLDIVNRKDAPRLFVVAGGATMGGPGRAAAAEMTRNDEK